MMRRFSSKRHPDPIPFMWSVHRLMLVSLLLLTAARLVLAASTGITEDEAHWLARPAAWHHGPTGPGLPAMLQTCVWLLGDSALGLRWLMPWFALGCSLLIFRLARGMFDANTAAWSVVVLNTMPWFNQAGIFVSPVAPALFFWLIALLGVWLGLLSASRWSRWWVTGGLALATAILIEPRMAATLAGLPALILLTRRWRGLARRPGPWIMATITALPVLVVAICTEYFHFGTLPDWKSGGGILDRTADLLLGWSPLLAVALIWAYANIREFRADPALAFLPAFALPFFLLLATGFGGPTVTGPIACLGAILLTRRVQHLRLPAARRAVARGLVLATAVLATLVPFHADLLRSAGIPVPTRIDAYAPGRAWPETSEILADALAQAGENGTKPTIIAETPPLAARLNLALHPTAPRDQPPPIGLAPNPRRDHAYAYRPRADSQQFSPGPPARTRVWLVRTRAPGTAPVPPHGALQAIRLTEILRTSRPWRQLEIWEIQTTHPHEW